MQVLLWVRGLVFVTNSTEFRKKLCNNVDRSNAQPEINMLTLHPLRLFTIFFCAALLVVGPAIAQGQQPATSSEGNAQNLVAAAARFYELKQYDRAIEVATNAVPVLPKDHRPWAIIANSYFAQWKMKSASEAYAKAAEINPRHKGLWYMKAYADRMRNAAEESIAAARKALEIDPNYALAYNI